MEVFKPPYFFRGARPVITSAPTEINYGTEGPSEFSIYVTRGNKVDRACLIGVGSATHHFDYGQRYIELMIGNKIAIPGQGLWRVDVRIPSKMEKGPEMIPEGCYLLFVVDEKGDGFDIPSKGKFVKVTF